MPRTGYQTPIRLPAIVVCFLLPAMLVNSIRGQATPDPPIRFFLQDNVSHRGSLQEIRPDGTCRIRLNGGERNFSSTELLRYGTPNLESHLDQIVMTDGTILAAVVETIDPESLSIVSRVFQNRKIPLALVRGIIFRQAENRMLRQKVLDRIQHGNRKNRRQEKNCLVVTAAGDEVRGQIDQPAAGMGGIRLDIGNFERFEEIAYVQFFSEAADTPKVSLQVPRSANAESFRIGMQDGSILVAKSLRSDAKSVTIETPLGLELRSLLLIRDKSFWSRVCFYRPTPTGFRFLSDVEPLRIVDSRNEIFHSTRTDRNSAGGPLQVDKVVFDKGIGTHADSQVIFPLQSDDKVFRALIGIDDWAPPGATALCRVMLLDTSNRWNAALSPITVTKDKLSSIDVPVSGYRAIGLVTGHGKGDIVGDRVNWVDARIYAAKSHGQGSGNNKR